MTSCEYEAQISYQIKNNSSAKLKIIYSYKDNKVIIDTIFSESNSIKILAVIGQGLNGVDYYKEKGDKLRDFSKIEIFQNDTLLSKTDFLETEKWIYDEKDSHSAVYLLTVTDSDFK